MFSSLGTYSIDQFSSFCKSCMIRLIIAEYDPFDKASLITLNNFQVVCLHQNPIMLSSLYQCHTIKNTLQCNFESRAFP
uniref:Uncharacterized protein n=1 Tax=Gossypium raimondii TaxID=29730 RepID=A0A0D2RAJ2_GOSRA|nr:hypothetical protein B456_004G253000 [Gossypium raimondii]